MHYHLTNKTKRIALIALALALLVVITIAISQPAMLAGFLSIVALGAVVVPSAADVVAKWIRRANAATQDYIAGVQTPSKDWAQAAVAAEANYKQAVVEAAGKGKFGKGVQKAGTPTWQRGAIEKGGPRWAPGIATGEGNFASGITAVLNTISSLSLPPRALKGDPRNLERVRLVADALHKKATT